MAVRTESVAIICGDFEVKESERSHCIKFVLFPEFETYGNVSLTLKDSFRNAVVKQHPLIIYSKYLADI